MKTEYEVRILEIDKEEIIKRLEEMGAVKKGEYEQKRYVYDLKPAEEGKWIRLRTNGKNTTITYKDIVSDKIDGTREVEFEVSDFGLANEFFEKIGYYNKGYQENRRIQYELDGIEIDIDCWPMIPTYLEVEANSEKEVLSMVDRLGINTEKMTSLDVKSIYRNYGINLDEIAELKF